MKYRFKSVSTAVLLMLLPLILGCSAFYLTNRFVKYEYKESFENNTAVKSTQKPNSDINQIQESEYYILKICNSIVYVTDDTETIIYEADIFSDIFTEKDKKTLERDGIIFESRSELIEFLIYLNS